MVTNTTVLVVGAGPTGLLLAAELCRRGVACRVVDANPGPLHWDRATVVHPRSLEVFESLGIHEPLLTQGVKQRMARLHSAGRLLGEIDLAICGSRYGFNIGISEEVTEQILTEYLVRQGGQVVRSSKLADLVHGENEIIATIDHEGRVEHVSARWVVGCDGVRSMTRKLSGIELEGHDTTEPWAVFDATLAGWSDSYEGNFAYLDDIPVILTALPRQRWRVYLRPSSEESDLVTDAATTIHRYLPTIGFLDVDHPTRFHCHTKVARHYRAGRILLAGDAAHVCSPSQGHGMNSGIQDAFNLAWKLALVCQGHCAESLLDSYEAERRPVAQVITTSGEAFENAQSLATSGERSARDRSLCATFADPTSRHHEAIAEAELDIDYAGSPIVMGNANAVLGPGNRLPDTIKFQIASGRSRLLHQLTHRAGHTALLVGGPNATLEILAQLETAIRSQNDGRLIEAIEVITIGTRPGQRCTQLAPAAAEQLGIDDITLLVIRPDGHVGLRADRNHVELLAAYQSLLAGAND